MNNQFDELSKSFAEGVSRREAPRRFGGVRTRDNRRPSTLCAISLVVLLASGTVANASTLTVMNANDKGPGSLRSVVNSAKNCDTITFAPSLNGQTITLTSDQLTISSSIDIEGPGASLLTISGNDINRIFNVNEGLNVTINGLTISHGHAVGGNGAVHGIGSGAGILNNGSVLTLANDVFSYNVSIGSNGGSPEGGAISNFHGGSLTVADTAFLYNRADGREKGGYFAEGGAIYTPRDGPNVTVIRCSFVGNQALGGDGGVATNKGFAANGTAAGGALHLEGTATLTVIDSTFIGNQAVGGSGGSGGPSTVPAIGVGEGGAIVSHDGGTLVIRGCSFSNNRAIGGSNASGGPANLGWIGTGIGGAVDSEGPATIVNCSFTDNQALGGSNNTGSGQVLTGTGYGGAIDNEGTGFPAPMTVTNCIFSNNLASGGASNVGGQYAGVGFGGGLSNYGNVATAVSGATFDGNQAIGGQGAVGGAGADGIGGGIANTLISSLTIKNCTVTHNQALGGAGGTGGTAGSGIGGGFYLTADGTACRDSFTSTNTFGNFASTTFNDVFGIFTICP